MFPDTTELGRAADSVTVNAPKSSNVREWMFGLLACGETRSLAASRHPFPVRDGAWLALADRLYAKVNPNGPTVRPELGACWQWTAYLNGSRNRRPAMNWSARYGNRPVYTSRVVWELHRGDIQDGQQINHHCDNDLCVRLDHLYLGTQTDNLRDASQRGRLHVPRRRTLTPEQREQIHALPPRRGLTTELAAQYGVSLSCISLIRRGRFVRQRGAHLSDNVAVPREIGSRPVESGEGSGEFFKCRHGRQDAATVGTGSTSPVEGRA